MICLITNRHLVEAQAFDRVVLKAIKAGIHRVILREKDLPTQALIAHVRVFKKAMDNHQQLIVHSDIEAALAADADGIQFRFQDFMALEKAAIKKLRDKSLDLGVSVHSLNEAVMACNHGATYLLASHVFDTACKAGRPGRGTGFIKSISGAVDIPVIALGGITPINVEQVFEAGAQGAAVMSALMCAPSPEQVVKAFYEAI